MSATDISERREYLERIVALTCFLGKQGISFRGHDETEESDNKGNFREGITLLGKFDPFLQRYTPPSNTTYLSCSSQNEMIECCSQEVTAFIVSEMRELQMFAIMADEARDGKTEQLALCVRYMSVKGAVKERFLALTEMPQFDAASITAAIENQLQEKGIEQLKCVAQTYDGAAVMSRAVGGSPVCNSRFTLQKETIDIAQAQTYKDAVIDTLKQKRSDATAADLHARTKAICEANQIAVLELSSGQRRKTKRMDGVVVESTCGAALAVHYHIEPKSEEVMVAKNFLKRKSEAGAIQDMLTMYSLLDYEMFPSLKAVIQVALTIPVSSCSCERSFSALRRLHTWLRRTMGQSRLQHLAVMSVEKEMLERVKHQKVIDRFATLKVRRHRSK
ncbi:hypothetical protein ABVT39_000691 [Epinephelus coioides]